MATRTRVRGDDYPLTFIYKINDVAIDISGATSLKFSYKNANNTVLTITGASTATVGEVLFTPTTGVDFIVEGVFTYDVQRIEGGFTYTHDKGTLILDGDITP